MPDLNDGDSVEMKGSGSKPYVLKNTGGVYSCTCPAWRNQSLPIERRTCKHLRKLRGDRAEEERIGSVLTVPPPPQPDSDRAPPPVLLAESWDNEANLVGWWMSEKLDGVRAFWDGRQFLSRQGNVYLAPDWFLEGLPPVPLDGELWVARKAFQRTVGIVRRQDRPKAWEEVRFVVFDAPAHGGEFEARLRFLGDLLGRSSAPYVQTLGHELCRGIDHLRYELRRVEEAGGEGLMLRQPGSKYVAGRSDTLLKVKTFRDAEAVVVGLEPGRGRHKGRMGALNVKIADGTAFSIGTGFSDAERANPPGVGAVVTFRYQELTAAGVPRFPSYVGLREPGDRAKGASAPSPAPAAKAPASPAVPTEKRYFECVEGGASKFWEVSVAGGRVTTRYGRIGGAGTTTIKDYADAEQAGRAAEKLVAEKLGKGYVETSAR
jgi:DNA ligase-1